MNKIGVVIKREYMTRVRSKAFIIGTVLSPLILLALILLPGLLTAKSGGERHIYVLDQSGDAALFEGIKNRLDSTSATFDNKRQFGNMRFTLVRVVVPPDANIEAVAKTYNDTIAKKSNEAYLILNKAILENPEPKYFAKNPGDLAVGNIERAISAEITDRRLAQAKLSKAEIEKYTKPVELKAFNPQGEEEKGVPRFVIGMVMLFFIYMTTLFYGIFVMRGVIEEKQSRIVEVLISSIRPFDLMMGKLIGIGLVGLTQYLIWVLCALALSVFGVSMFASQGVTVPHIPISWLIYFVLFFILGYFLFATLYAMVGAMVSSEEDAQQAQMPVTMVVVLPMLLFGMVMANPDSTLSTVLSMIPFFAPTLMMMRVAMVNPPMYQVVGAMLGMIVTIIAVVWLVAKIYRVGILMYGKRPSIAELGKWIRYR
ncbi:MAG: ABC transporter permease [Acidobacteria bacterium]|nr:ABC transporter permease [Acidobacteriota bacterium]